MGIRVVCVGKAGEPHFAAATEYLKRIRRYIRIELVEVADEPVDRRPDDTVRRVEGERLLKALGKPSCVILADRQGRQLTSEQFAARLNDLLVSGKSDITFAVGGTLGVTAAVRARADETISFSQMTMAHQLARVVLLEQIYRAFKIIRGEKYHR